MRYVIAGKKSTAIKYANTFKCHFEKGWKYVSKKCHLDTFNDDDGIILLHGWWAKKWAPQRIKEIKNMFPTLIIDEMDGFFGEEVRKALKSDTIYNRFEILDL